MTIEELVARPNKARIAIEAGKAAATTCTNGRGSTNLNRVVIPGLWARHLPNLPGYAPDKSLYRRQGSHLDTPWPGIGNQHSACVQPMH
ncbi:hypothetical protein ACIPM0_09455 [Pseudomonas sichuanensis]|uniref:hypothetical protein n=1 Tax=Pseudomonas sichuanensis TaxID=2213015 RepID=UPI00382E4A3F